MAIVKRVSDKIGVYYFNTKTNKRAAADEYHKSAATKSSKSPKSKASTPSCAKAGYGVKVLKSSAAGKKLQRCGK